MGLATETRKGSGQEVTLTLDRDDVVLLDRCLRLAGRGTVSDGVVRFLTQHARGKLLDALHAAEAGQGRASPVQPQHEEPHQWRSASGPDEVRPDQHGLAHVPDARPGGRDRSVAAR